MSVTVAPQTYFEDVVIGETLTTPAITLTQAHIALYTGLSGETCDEPDRIPELLALSVCTGLAWRVDRPPLAVLAFVGFEWQAVRTLHIGDTIHTASAAASRRSLREGGIIIENHDVIDQNGQVVQRGRFTFLVARRPRPDA